MSEIFKGDIIEWLPSLAYEMECKTPEPVLANYESLVERILYIRSDIVFVIELTVKLNVEKKVLPYERTKMEILRALDGGFAIRRTVDPYSNYANPDKKYIEKYKDVRDKTWDVIRKIVNKEPDIYIPKLRGPLIKEAVDEHKVYKRVVYKYLSRWWVGGMSINTLLPSFDKCGGPGNDRIIPISPTAELDPLGNKKKM